MVDEELDAFIPWVRAGKPEPFGDYVLQREKDLASARKKRQAEARKRPRCENPGRTAVRVMEETISRGAALDRLLTREMKAGSR